jgi:hypothetical protein
MAATLARAVDAGNLSMLRSMFRHPVVYPNGEEEDVKTG